MRWSSSTTRASTSCCTYNSCASQGIGEFTISTTAEGKAHSAVCTKRRVRRSEERPIECRHGGVQRFVVRWAPRLLPRLLRRRSQLTRRRGQPAERALRRKHRLHSARRQLTLDIALQEPPRLWAFVQERIHVTGG